MNEEERAFIGRRDTDRRLGLERRRFSYSGHIPERRMIQEDRRSNDERRKQ